jgi:hypothetical protein
MQAPCEEDRVADRMIMRQATAMEGGHLQSVATSGKILSRVKRPIANRPQVNNLPHRTASKTASKAASQPPVETHAG